LHLEYPEPELSDGVVRLRPWEHGDVDCVRLAATDPRIPNHTTVPRDFTRAEGIAFIERQWSRQTNGEGLSLAIIDARSDEAVGSIVALFRRQRGVGEVGYWLVPSARGRGFAGRAVALVSRWLLSTTPTTRVQAIIEPANTPSRRSVERSGFREEGVLRSYLDGEHDVIMYSLLPSDLNDA
jgi:RimJ/RimL family protein N-acetyltransferase